jgi:membrane-bound lytic murein transglycosylase F
MRKPLLSVPFILLAALAGCSGELAVPPPVERDLERVVSDGTLNALMTFNSTSYFIYRGEPMGFEYELLRRFARDHDLDLQVDVIRDAEEILPRLNRGEADVAAARIFRRLVADTELHYTVPIQATRIAVVQRTGPPSEIEMPALAQDAVDLEPDPDAQISARIVNNPADLAGRRVHIPNRSPIEEVLVEVLDESTGEIEIVQVRGVASAEPLIRRVARGEISLTASPEDVARLSGDYFDNLAVRPSLGPEINVVWALRTNAPQLESALNSWIGENRDYITELYEKYFADRRGYQERIQDDYLTSETGRLSQYDGLLKKHAPALGWDWRLLASQTYQESKFDPNARSWAGAVGLLQLMPGTAREVGVKNSRNPEENVAGGVRYLQKLTKAWTPEIPDEQERLKFVLASYNAGRGHVLDAQRLAEKNGQDPKVWENVAYWMIQKSKRAVYTDPVVRYGYVRGLEPVTYVELILSRYDHYLDFVTQEPETRGTAVQKAS